MTVPAKRATSGDQTALLRQMPSVDELLQLPAVAKLCLEIDRGFVVDTVRQVLSQLRREIAREKSRQSKRYRPLLSNNALSLLSKMNSRPPWSR